VKIYSTKDITFVIAPDDAMLHFLHINDVRSMTFPGEDLLRWCDRMQTLIDNARELATP
jgi:hypothetical protein